MSLPLEFDSDAARQFCNEHLGPVSLALLDDEAASRAIATRVARGTPVHDAVLAELFDLAKRDPAAAGEFLAFFGREFSALPRHWISPALRRQFDTEDVLASIVGDLWENMRGLEFINRAAFLGLLRRRFDWKIRNKLAASRAQKRREDLRVEASSPEPAAEEREAGPATEAAESDERQFALSLVDRLTPRDRSLILALFRHESVSEIAAEHELSVDATSAALRRAIQQLKALVNRHRGRPDSGSP